MTSEFCLKMPDFHVTFRELLHAVNLQHGTNGFTSLLKEGVLRIFFTLKNPMASAGFELVNLDAKGQHATSRPPRSRMSPAVPEFWALTGKTLPYFFFISDLNIQNGYTLFCNKQIATFTTNLYINQ